MEKETVLGTIDVADILNCSVDEVIDLARNGEIKAFKYGESWKFRRSDVKTYERDHLMMPHRSLSQGRRGKQTII